MHPMIIFFSNGRRTAASVRTEILHGFGGIICAAFFKIVLEGQVTELRRHKSELHDRLFSLRPIFQRSHVVSNLLLLTGMETLCKI